MMDRIGELRDQAKIKVNLGCGETPFDGFINVDIQESPCKPDLIADCRNLPFPDASVDWLECHQMLEHFELEEGFKVLAEMQRVVKKDGHILITVPDIIGFFKGFVTAIGHLPEVWPGIVRYIYGGKGDYNRHVAAFSPQYLHYKISEYGFNCETFSWHLRATPSFAVLGCRV